MFDEETTTEYHANCYYIAEQDSIQLKNCMCCQEPFDFKDNPVWMNTSSDPLSKWSIYSCKKCKSVYIYYL